MSAPTDLSHQLQHRCREVIELELARLRRRVPGLAADDLEAVERATDELARQLVVTPVAHHPEYAAEAAVLFDLRPAAEPPHA